MKVYAFLMVVAAVTSVAGLAGGEAVQAARSCRVCRDCASPGRHPVCAVGFGEADDEAMAQAKARVLARCDERGGQLVGGWSDSDCGESSPPPPVVH